MASTPPLEPNQRGQLVVELNELEALRVKHAEEDEAHAGGHVLEQLERPSNVRLSIRSRAMSGYRSKRAVVPGGAGDDWEDDHTEAVHHAGFE